MEFDTILKALTYRSELTPDRVLLMEGLSGRTCTYRELYFSALHLAERLRISDVGRGDRVVVRVKPGAIETVVAAIGVYMCGAVFCPIGNKLSTFLVKEKLNYFNTQYLISQEILDDYRCFSIDELFLKAKYMYRGNIEFPEVTEQDICDIIFTTGTTGKPKGVMLSYRTRMECARDLSSFFGLAECDVMLKSNSMSFVGFMRWFCAAVISNCMIVLFEGGAFLSEYTEIIRKHGVTVMEPPVSALQLFLRSGDNIRAWHGLRYLGLVTQVVPESVWTRLEEYLPETVLYNAITPTEVGSIVQYNATRYGIKPNCLGTTQAEDDVAILDENFRQMRESSADNPGIIAWRRDKAMAGYWGDDELTASVFRNGWLITADLGYIDERGFLCFLGRRDDVINSGGYKIAPHEVENAAARIDGVQDCVCIAQSNDVLGEAPCLLLVMADGAEFDARNISRQLRELLDVTKLPRTVKQIPEIPLIGNTGKTDRRALIEMYGGAY